MFLNDTLRPLSPSAEPDLPTPPPILSPPCAPPSPPAPKRSPRRASANTSPAPWLTPHSHPLPAWPPLCESSHSNQTYPRSRPPPAQAHFALKAKASPSANAHFQTSRESHPHTVPSAAAPYLSSTTTAAIWDGTGSFLKSSQKVAPVRAALKRFQIPLHLIPTTSPHTSGTPPRPED